MYAALRDHEPVHHVDHGGYWVLSRYDDVLAAFRDPERFSSAQGLTTVEGDMAAIGIDEAKPIVMLDPPEHTAFRRLVAKGFTPRRVEDVEPVLRAFVVERVERLRAAGAADVVAELFAPLPNLAVAHYLGVPESDRALFGRWTEAIVAANAEGDVFSATEAVTEMFGYFTELDRVAPPPPGRGHGVGPRRPRRGHGRRPAGPRLRLHHGHRRQRHDLGPARPARPSCSPRTPTSGPACRPTGRCCPTPSRSCSA